MPGPVGSATGHVRTAGAHPIGRADATKSATEGDLKLRAFDLLKI
jgi:hypothetical protein